MLADNELQIVHNLETEVLVDSVMNEDTPRLDAEREMLPHVAEIINNFNKHYEMKLMQHLLTRGVTCSEIRDVRRTTEMRKLERLRVPWIELSRNEPLPSLSLDETVSALAKAIEKSKSKIENHQSEPAFTKNRNI